MRKSSLLWHTGVILLLLLVIILFCLGVIQPLEFHFFSSGNTEPIAFNKTWINPSNKKQYAASVKMDVFDQRLYLLEHNVLYSFNGVDFTKITEFDGTAIAIDEDIVYYMIVEPEAICTIYSYHIPDGTHKHMITTELVSHRDCYFENGIMYIPSNRACTQYYPIKDGQIGLPVEKKEQYIVQGNTFTLEYLRGSKELICYDKDGKPASMKDQIPFGIKSLIPCSNGVLIHNEMQGDLLYFIEDTTSHLVELFTVECMSSISAVNTYQTNIYLSFRRFEKHGQLGMVGYKNDTLEGTYRISLIDYSVEKLSNDVYDGLYIFDDTGIYACDSDYNVYKLDFEGNKIAKLVEF